MISTSWQMQPQTWDPNWVNVAILSDIHSNAFALKAAIQDIHQHKVDMVICLGDLLTYGCQPKEVIELLQELQMTYPCHFIKGNHDQFYFENQHTLEDPFFPDRLPSFIQESLIWTLNQLDFKLFDIFDWKEDFQMETLLFAHANPFSYLDWRYLDNVEKLLLASQTLTEREIFAGFFGHTHRPMIAAINTNSEIQFFKNEIEIPKVEGLWKNLICNPGSIGQPRGQKNSLMYIQNTASHFKIQISYLDYEVDALLKTIQTSTLSESSKIKLCAFFKENS